MLIKRCIVCGEPVKRHQFLCMNCNRMLDCDRFDTFSKRCKTCFYPLADSDYDCPHCKAVKDFPVFSICDYSAPFPRRILENYKFIGEKDLSSFFAYEFNLAIEKSMNEKDKESILIVPVPSSATSLIKRGWDQMNEISKKLKKHYHFNCANLLALNEENSKEQKKLTREDRISSSQSKYVINCAELQKTDVNCTVILIDDITTSGSTLASCRQVLVNSGFKRIKAVTWLAEL